jgi:hypothetical protein
MKVVLAGMPDRSLSVQTDPGKVQFLSFWLAYTTPLRDLFFLMERISRLCVWRIFDVLWQFCSRTIPTFRFQ